MARGWRKVGQDKDSVTWKHQIKKNVNVVVQRDKIDLRYFHVFYLTPELDATIHTMKTVRGEINTPIRSAIQFMEKHTNG
jgi:hypothetical protein